MEALVALSLAANIVQFVDFSSRLFSSATSIHRSAFGASQNVQDVDSLTEELRQWCDKISSSPGSSSQFLRAHPSLLDLARKCHLTATELLSATESLKSKHPGSNWRSFKAALATAWNEEKIKSMAERLDAYRRQLALEIALLQR
jgi:hypothetical protein